MSLVFDKNRYEKINLIFNKHAAGRKDLPNKVTPDLSQKIVKFWGEMGVGNELFMSDFYYYFP